MFVDANNMLNVSCQLLKSNNTQISLYDLNGRVVNELLAKENLSSGKHEYQFPVIGQSKGIYFLRVEIGNTNQIQKILL